MLRILMHVSVQIKKTPCLVYLHFFSMIQTSIDLPTEVQQMLEAHVILVVEGADYPLTCLFSGVCAEYRAGVLAPLPPPDLFHASLRESPSGKQVPPVWCGAG